MDPRRYSFFLWAPFIIGTKIPGEEFTETLTRTKFEELNMELFRSTMKPIQKMMEEADTQKKDVDEIVEGKNYEIFYFLSKKTPKKPYKIFQVVDLTIGFDVTMGFVSSKFGNAMAKKTVWMDPTKTIVLNTNLREELSIIPTSAISPKFGNAMARKTV